MWESLNINLCAQWGAVWLQMSDKRISEVQMNLKHLENRKKPRKMGKWVG